MTALKTVLESSLNNPFAGWPPHEEYFMFLLVPKWLRDGARMGTIFPDLDAWEWDEP